MMTEITIHSKLNAAMLCQATGLRPETAKQIRRSMVKVSEGIIHLPKAILKGKKKDMEIIITQPVQVILDLVEEQRKKNPNTSLFLGCFQRLGFIKKDW